MQAFWKRYFYPAETVGILIGKWILRVQSEAITILFARSGVSLGYLAISAQRHPCLLWLCVIPGPQHNDLGV